MSSAKVVSMTRPMPSTEAERTQEAQELLSHIEDSDLPSLTGWELNTVKEIQDGKAANAIRLRELRSIVKRLQDAHVKEA